ncbi:hypothetical protein TIFTF001_031091 [Ficus carica]|uniref:Protein TRIGALACTOSYLDIACYLGLYCEROL 4, chloroplastic n=1 Tax=Ficus carica TaxID=3494 RepID=A0AA88DWA4_FICCA|nr:hypothetical protein TIFTF001_031091 [Ficus carica]
MARLRTAMDSAFWDLNVATPQVLDGTAKSIPGEPFPMDGARGSRALRIQQVSLLGNGFPLGIIPSYSPTSSKDLGSFTLQSLLLAPSTSNWDLERGGFFVLLFNVLGNQVDLCGDEYRWLGLIGQFRPKKLFSSIRAEFKGDDGELPSFKDVARHFLDKSLYSFGLSTQLSPTPSTSIKWSTEGHESISLDLLSLVSESGLRYRLGLHKSSGDPLAVNATSPEAPASLMPGICAKAAFSYEKSRDFWRKEEQQKDIIEKTDRGLFWRPSYDVRLNEPHSAISGIIGGTCAAWYGDKEKRSPLSADLFGSVCYTIQHGSFRKYYGDLTRLDTRLDICSASALAKRVLNGFKSSSSNKTDDPTSHPRLNLIFQQQVAGPIAVRLDSRILLNSSSGKRGPQMEDFICSLTYSFRLLESGKAVFWYSPKRKEGMVELRLFEF